MMPANHSGPVRRVRLYTERLVLRPTNRTDADRAFEIQSDWDVTRMLRMARFPPDLDETVGWFAEHEQEWLAGTAYRFAVLREGRMIGLVDIDEVAGGEGDLGYWFEQASWGQGFAFEAARAVVDFAFGKLGLTRLRSGHAADNPASGNVLSKLGFHPLGATHRASRSRGHDILHQSYVLSGARRLPEGDRAMIFRDGTPGDREAIASLHVLVSRLSYAGILSADYLATVMPEEKARLWQQRLAQGVDPAKMCLTLADDGSDVVGFACFLFDHEPEFGTYLHNLYVAPNHQGKGVARRLLMESIRRFSTERLERPVHLLALAENHAARRFYARLNGRLVEEKQNVMTSYPDVRFVRFQWPTAREMSKAAWPASA